MRDVCQSNDAIREILVRKQMCQTEFLPIRSTEFLKHTRSVYTFLLPVLSFILRPKARVVKTETFLNKPQVNL
jgi:hypothetical protein